MGTQNLRESDVALLASQLGNGYRRIPPNHYVIRRIVLNPFCARLAEKKRRIVFPAIFPERWKGIALGWMKTIRRSFFGNRCLSNH
jgi:hypothetical protein